MKTNAQRLFRRQRGNTVTYLLNETPVLTVKGDGSFTITPGENPTTRAMAVISHFAPPQAHIKMWRSEKRGFRGTFVETSEFLGRFENGMRFSPTGAPLS